MTETAFTPPTPTTWTFRLKSHKTTVLLHVDPMTSFLTLKTHLHTALSQTALHDPDTGAEIPLPPSPEEIQLGRPVNINDARMGFHLGEWEYAAALSDADADGRGAKGKGKGKVVPGRGRPGKGVGGDDVKNTPKGQGLRDGAVLAFRWRGDGSAEWEDEREDVDMDSEGGVQKGGAVGAGAKKVDMWGVRLASFEDSYGVENEIDVGGGREFEG